MSIDEWDIPDVVPVSTAKHSVDALIGEHMVARLDQLQNGQSVVIEFDNGIIVVVRVTTTTDKKVTVQTYGIDHKITHQADDGNCVVGELSLGGTPKTHTEYGP